MTVFKILYTHEGKIVKLIRKIIINNNGPNRCWQYLY